MADHEVMLTPADEEQTRRFLKTNGPPAGIFSPDPIVEKLIFDAKDSMSDREKWLYRTLSTNTKQNDYSIQQESGKKMALRMIQDHQTEADKKIADLYAVVEPFVLLRQKWTSRGALVKHVLGLIFTAVILGGMAIWLGEMLLAWSMRKLGWQK